MNWTRKMLKDNAKQEMRGSFKHYFLLDIVTMIIIMIPIIPLMVVLVNFANAIDPLAPELIVIPGTFWLAYLFVLVTAIFIDGPLIVGLMSCYVRSPSGDKRFGNLFSAFTSGKYLAAVGAMLRLTIFITLWSLLFIIPGIIKAYQYRMVPYIISESPGITGKEAMRISRQMTAKQKGSMFVLDLSFIGWGILTIIPYLIVTLVAAFAFPGTVAAMVFALIVFIASIAVLEVYIQAVFTQLYFVMRAAYFALNPEGSGLYGSHLLEGK